jgi:RNA polymerase sigma-70 factor (ECF subfamily)
VAFEQALMIADQPATFEQIVRRHERLVMAVALGLLGRREDAEDAAQEVFVRLHKYLPKFDAARPFEPWLYRMTVNVCRDLGRKRRPDDELEDTAADPTAGPDEQARSAQARRILRAALLRLPERERAAVVLRDIEGLATSAVAGILGTSEATVRSHLSHGRLRILKLTERYRRTQP